LLNFFDETFSFGARQFFITPPASIFKTLSLQMVRSRRKTTKSSDSKSTAGKKTAGTKPAPDAQIETRTPFEVDVAQSTAGFEEYFREVEDYAIILLDTKGTIRSWNKGAEKIKGYKAVEIIGKNYRIFYTKEDKEINLSDTLLKQAKTNRRANYEGWRVKKDGTRFWGSITLTALHNAEGNIHGYLKVTRDLTDKKIAEDNHSNFLEELKIKNEQLRKSEERYHKMISEVMDYAIILLDVDGKVLDWNKGAEKLKGYTAKEIVGKSFRLFYPKDDKDRKLPESLLAEAAKNGSANHEGWRIRKDGTRFWGNVSITSLHDSDGKLIGYSKVTRDLTERKIAEDRVSNVFEELRQANEFLKQSEERYHRMIDEIQDYAIILLNTEGDIQNWNAGAEQIKGYKAHEIVGKNFRQFYAREDRERKLPETLLAEARNKGRVDHEGWRVRKDGTRFWGHVVLTALHDAEGNITGFSKVTRDLTEKKNAEDALKANAAQLDLKNKTLQRLNEELSSFTHVASHDLKEPLRKIKIFAGRMEEAASIEKNKEFIDKIKSSATRMEMLIEDLLSYSHVSNDNAKLEKVDLNKIVQSAKGDLEIAITDKQAVIKSDRLPHVAGISYQLHQLFLNLLSNSLKFSKHGERPEISIKAQTIKGPDIPGEKLNGSNKYHHIRVTDNGIGFAHEHADRIFEAFQRLHPKHAFSGSGIGLAIVKKVMENHNGIVSAEGNPDVGATFHLYFPAVKE
jgi:PAS domain S-box-containing protein